MTCPNCGNEMKGDFCEHCGTVVEFRPNVPPPPGGFRPPQKKKKTWIFIVLGVIVAVALLGILFGEEEEADSSQTVVSVESSLVKEDSPKVREEGSEPSKTNEPVTYTSGDVFEVGNFEVTVGEVELSEGSDFNEASEGQIYVYVPLEVKNIADKDEYVSSIAMFDAYCDDIAVDEDFSAMVNTGYKTMNGTIANGKKVVGALSYQLPKDWKVLEIVLDANLFGFKEKKATIIISNN